MAVRRLGFVGAGAIAHEVCAVLPAQLAQPYDQVMFLVRPDDMARFEGEARTLEGRLARRVTLTSDINAFIAGNLEKVVECAGHGALQAYGSAILETGVDVLCVSSGALSDDGLRNMLVAAAQAGGARLAISAGALAGIDALLTARYSGLTHVAYTSRKPPLAWRDTPAEDVCDLGALTTATTVFEGTARDAARLYPKNANVAATIALAGLGFDATIVRIVADPHATGNEHELDIRSEAFNLTARLVGRPSPLNPKTSLTTAYALTREILGSDTGIEIRRQA